MALQGHPRSLILADDTQADIILATDIVGRQGGPTADNKEYSSLRHYRVIVQYR